MECEDFEPSIIQDNKEYKKEEYISINKIAEVKGLKSNRSIRLELNKPERYLFVSKSYLKSKTAIKHPNEERLTIKNIYLRSYRKVLSRSFAHKFYLHLAEKVCEYEKPFKQRYAEIFNLLNIT